MRIQTTSLLALLALAACNPEQGEIATPVAGPTSAKLPTEDSPEGLAADLSAGPTEDILLRLEFTEGAAWGEETEMSLAMGIVSANVQVGVAFEALDTADGTTRIRQSTEWMRVEVQSPFAPTEDEAMVYDSRDPDGGSIMEAFMPAGMDLEEVAAEMGEGYPYDFGMEEMFGLGVVVLVDARKRIQGYEIPDEMAEMPGMPGFSYDDFDMESWMPAMEGFGWGNENMVFPEEPVALGHIWTQQIRWEMDYADLFAAMAEHADDEEMSATEEEMREMWAEMGEATGEMGFALSMTADLTHEVMGWWEGLLRIRTEGDYLVEFTMPGMEQMMEELDGISVSIDGELLWHPSGYIAGSNLTISFRLDLGEEMGGGMGGFGMMASMFMPTINITMRRVDATAWTDPGEV
ncbi:hypothetical protein IIA16_01960 [bacterium]|nr:hypothetical protein [bacterium]